MLQALTPLGAPAVLLLAGAASFFDRRPRASWGPSWAEAASVLAVLTAILSAGVLIVRGPGDSPVLGVQETGGLEMGLAVRLDVVSVVMLLLVTVIGWVVVRFARTALDGEARHGAFTGWLCLTLAAVTLLVTAGDLFQLVGAWIATSLVLHRLLLFHPQRIGARRAARKKFILARCGDAALLGAAVLLTVAYGTSDIGAILAAARSGAGGGCAVGAAGLLALAAGLKSAQCPVHGWLTEVMETPTPVSALLHAGVINAGGVLLVRFADVMLLAPGVLAALVVIGGFTALFGSLVMLTQPAVKTALAWSTVAQMGFMVFECGLGLFPLALLHIVAHALYKAHAFLASGGAVERVTAMHGPGPVAAPDGAAVARAFLSALGIYAVVSLGFGAGLRFGHTSPQATALGAILIFGVAYMLAQGFADAAPRALTRRTAVYALATSVSYFALQAAAIRLTAGDLPPPPPPGPLEAALIALAVASFGLVAVLQALLPRWIGHPAAAGVRVHLANGLYANAVLDRLIGTWSVRPASRSPGNPMTPQEAQ